MAFRRRRIPEDIVGDAAVGDQVRPLLHRHRRDRGHRLSPRDVDLRQLLDESEDGVELAPKVLDLLLGDRNAGQMGNAADGIGVDGHGASQLGRRACNQAGYSRVTFRAATPTAVAPAGGNPDIGPVDAANPSATPTFASRTPLHIGAIGLKVRDIDRLTSYYRDVLGLSVLDRGQAGATLGAGGVALVHLEHQPHAKPDDNRTAGLYHTAFLVPTRADLARWILHVARNKVRLTGASDHAVSEAFYLDDPEGNGIEVYHDRPAESWEWTGDALKITTDPLDIDDILREVPDTASYDGAPGGLRIGHVHLRVGDVGRAEAFYRDSLGLDVTRRRHGASFMSSGRYHHHIAGNVWHSAGAGRREEDRAGLSWFSLEASDDAALEAAKSRLGRANAPLTTVSAGIETADPWGTRLRIVRA
jgi:catechol 2,3-dioxygenase